MIAFRKVFLPIFVLAILHLACGPKQALVLQLPEEGQYFDLLSDYGIIASGSHGYEVNKQLIKYEVINELFSDYAEKGRYVFVPEGKTATLKRDGFFDWPEGSIMVKNFGYSDEQLDEGGRLMETRLLIKDPSEWKAISYIWDKDGKDAIMSKVGDVFPLAINHEGAAQSFDYVVPNKNQCKSCHNHNEKIDPLGFKFANLNTSIRVDGSISNQIAYLESKGIIEINNFQDSIETMIDYKDEEKDIQDRALAYLDINCGHCHRPEGPGNTSGLFLQYNETRSNHLGFCKGPVAAGKGSGGRTFDIFPGRADSSILYYRMSSVDPGIMMPEVGRSLAHKEGLSIIKEWIDGLEYDCFDFNGAGD